jgi:hypothetical protein
MMVENYQHLIEWIGYIGSVIIAVSLMMNSIIKLRWLNLLGASIFSTYGFIIGSLPVALLNLFISLINIYYLYKIYNQKDFLKILQVNPQDNYLKFFINYYKQEIDFFFPAFFERFKNKQLGEENLFCFLLIRNAAVSGFFIGHKSQHDELMVEIDFSIPEYRDMKTGAYVYKQNKNFFKSLGINRFIAETGNKKHDQYLKKMGFRERTNEGGQLYLTQELE